MFTFWQWFSLNWRASIIFAWYDLWMGVFIDRRNEFWYRIYIFPLPTIGIVLEIRK